MEGTIVPVSLGVVAEPPTLILLYEEEEGSKKLRKKRRRRMPVRHFNDKSDVGRAAFAVRQRHEKWMKDVSAVTVERMLRIVQEMIKGLSKEEAVALVDSEFKVGAEEDLNVVGEDVLRRKKAGMEEEWRRVAVLPGDPGYVYDKQEEFGDAKDPSGWDEDEEEVEEDNVEKHEVSVGAIEVKENIPPADEDDEEENHTNSSIPLCLESSKDLNVEDEDDDFWA